LTRSRLRVRSCKFVFMSLNTSLLSTILFLLLFSPQRHQTQHYWMHRLSNHRTTILTRLQTLTNKKSTIESKILSHTAELFTAYEEMKKEYRVVLEGRIADCLEAEEKLKGAGRRVPANGEGDGEAREVGESDGGRGGDDVERKKGKGKGGHANL
jgi:hypothetical protein